MKKKTKKPVRKQQKAPVYTVVVGVFTVITAIVILNPSPSPFTPKNIYQKAMHTFFHEESEYTTDAYVSDILAQTGEYDPSADGLVAIFDNNPVTAQAQSPSQQFLTSVLPAHTGLAQNADSKWIEIDLSDQKLYAWENGNKAYEFQTSTGRPWTPTLTGDFRIWIKLRYTRMTGGSKERGDYYSVPNVPYVMYYDRGYGIHGAYWHNNFGNVMSHGCVNLRPEEAGQLYEWATPVTNGKSSIKSTPDNPGTRVVIHN